MPLTGGPQSVALIVEGAYNEWRRHHDRCEYCSQEDWYNPGFPRKVTSEDFYDAVLETPNGPTYWVHGPDSTVLCDEGRRLFNLWVKTTMLASARTF